MSLMKFDNLQNDPRPIVFVVAPQICLLEICLTLRVGSSQTCKKLLENSCKIEKKRIHICFVENDVC